MEKLLKRVGDLGGNHRTYAEDLKEAKNLYSQINKDARDILKNEPKNKELQEALKAIETRMNSLKELERLWNK